jgi:flavin reductase (DIM6/NTAB) family NADH-FMN oxidoreductase RutF
MELSARKKTLRLLSNGVYVITSCYKNQYGAATITWVSQASFNPPLLMAAIRTNSNVFRCLAPSGFAAIHVLGHDQQDLAQKFFSPTKAAAGVINGEPFTDGMTQSPILRNAHAHMECRVVRIIDDVGDHAVVIFEVVNAECNGMVRPLTIAESPWQYGG